MSELINHNQIPGSNYTVELVLLTLLKAHEKSLRDYNRRIKRQAASLIKKFGFFHPLLVDGSNTVVGGTLYFLAAKMLELNDVPVVRVTHLSDEQIRLYRIAEERLSELAPWNKKALGEEFKFLSVLEPDFDFEIVGFSPTEVDNAIASLDEMDQPNNDDIHLTLAQSNPVSVLGDLWKLHHHRVTCGSALDRPTWSALMEDDRASLVFTDPPYNVKINGHVSGNGQVVHREFAMASGEMTTDGYRDFLRSFMKNAHDHARDGSLHYVCIDWRHVDDVLAVGRSVFTDVINMCCWIKPNAGMGSFYRSRHELIPVFRKGKKQHRNNIELGRHGRNRSNVWEYAGATTFAGRTTEEGNILAMHPTAKPVDMIVDAIMDSTARNEIVADPFLGSGATLIAAERIGRRLYGIELDPLYVDVAIRRWQKHTGQNAIHVASGKTFNEIRAGGGQANV